MGVFQKTLAPHLHPTMFSAALTPWPSGGLVTQG